MRCVLIGRCLKTAPWMEYTSNQAQIALVAAGERGAIHPGGLSVFVFWDRLKKKKQLSKWNRLFGWFRCSDDGIEEAHQVIVIPVFPFTFIFGTLWGASCHHFSQFFLLQHFWNPVGKYCLSIGWRIVMTYFFPFLETSPPLQSCCFQLRVIEWFAKTKKRDCKGKFCVQVVSCWSDLPKQRKGIFCNDRFLCQDQTAVDGFKSS